MSNFWRVAAAAADDLLELNHHVHRVSEVPLRGAGGMNFYDRLSTGLQTLGGEKVVVSFEEPVTRGASDFVSTANPK